MVKFVKGEVVVIPFPFTGLSFSKKRPALILQSLYGDDLIMYQITSHSRIEPNIISLNNDDFETGNLSQNSFIRPTMLFTLDSNLIEYSVGHINQKKLNIITETLIQLLKKY